MTIKKIVLLFALLLAAAFVLAACAGPVGQVGPAGAAGPIGPAGPAGAAGTNPSAADLSCTQCHNNTTLISGKEQSWSASVHASGPAFAVASGRAPCTACHTGVGFIDRIAAGLTNPDQFTTTYSNPTRQDCRTCHKVHTTYTKDDFALTTTSPVPLYVLQGVTFDGGKGNLCANCHQARSLVPAPAADGTVNVDSTHWGPHHGPEAELLIGAGGAGDVIGAPGPHYKTVPDTCITCHMGGAGPDANHTFTPNVANCLSCHPDAKNFDMNGKVTEFDGKLAALKAALTKAGLLDKDGNIVVGNYPAAQANALWNFLFLDQDKSHGVHNMPYADALIDAGMTAFTK